MNVYMQLASSYFRPPGLKAKEFEYPAFSPLEFVRVMQVSLCMGSDLGDVRNSCDSVSLLVCWFRSWTFAAWT